MRSKTVKARVIANKIRRRERHETSQWDKVIAHREAEMAERRKKYIAQHGEEAYHAEVHRQVQAQLGKLARNSQYGAHTQPGAFPDPSWIQG